MSRIGGESAAAFAYALVKSGEIKQPRGVLVPDMKTAVKAESSVPRAVPSPFVFQRAYPQKDQASIDDLSWNAEGSRLAVLLVTKFLIIGPVGEEHRLGKDLASMYNLEWSPDGRLLVAGTANGLYVWTTDEWERIGNLRGKTPWNTHQVSWSVSQNVLASAQGSRIDLWKIAIDEFNNLIPEVPFGSLTGFSGDANCLLFSPDGGLLASSHADGALQIWDVELRKSIATVQTNDEFVWNLSWSPDGQSLAYRGRYRLAVWESLRSLRVLESGPMGLTGGISFSGDGKLLGYGLGDAVHFKSCDSWNSAYELPAGATHLWDVLQVSFAHGQEKFAIAGRSQ